MSLERAKALVDKMKADDKFRGQVMQLEDVGERLEAVKNAGFECSADELQQTLEELQSVDVGDTECTFCAPQHLKEPEKK